MLCYAKSLQSCPTLCDPIGSSPPGSPVPGILQARTLEWVAISFSNAWKWKVKVKSLSRVRTAPSRLLHPWHFPGKSTGVGCHCLLRCTPLQVLKLCFHLTVCHGHLSKSIPMDLTHLNNSSKPKSILIVMCYVNALKIYLTGPLPCFLNILLLRNADINILNIYVVTQMFSHTRFLSPGFAWWRLKDQLHSQVFSRYLYGFWAL